MPVPRPASPLIRSLSVAGAVALIVGLSATSGQAAPTTPAPRAPTTSAEALTQMRTLYKQFATLSEDYDDARIMLGKRTAASRAAAVRAENAAFVVAGYRAQVKRLVKSESRSDPFDTFGAMVSSGSPGDFVAQASLLNVVTTRRAAVVNEAAKASSAAATAESRARAATKAAAALTRDLATRKADLSRRAGQAAALFQRLSATERMALSAAQTPEAADRASRSTRTQPTPGGAPSASGGTPPAAVPVSGRAGVAVTTARAQVGKPYVWGATGPGTFDCSGLTGYSWRAAGVTIPRTSRQQYAAGTKVSRSALQPGDLVYFGSPIYHVAVYIGNNTMVSAPQPGDVVKYQSVDAFSDYAGATRPG